MQGLQINFDNNCQLDRSYPHLVRFELDDRPDNNLRDLTNFFRLNPQLKSVKAPFFDRAAHIQATNELLPELQEIVIGNRDWNDDSPVGDTKIHFKNVKKLTYQLHHNYSELSDNMRETLTAMQFDQLDTLRVEGNVSESTSKSFLLHLIEEYKTLNSLEFWNYDLT